MNESEHEVMHKMTDEKIKEYDIRIGKVEDKQDRLELAATREETVVQNLCEKIDSLINTIKWAGGILITALLGFFIWYIQSL